MSMSTHICGFKAATPIFIHMRDAWKACIAAGVDPPREVMDFFDGELPDDDAPGLEVALDEDLLTEITGPGHRGYQIHLASLPDHITHLRFYNSW